MYAKPAPFRIVVDWNRLTMRIDHRAHSRTWDMTHTTRASGDRLECFCLDHAWAINLGHDHIHTTIYDPITYSQ